MSLNEMREALRVKFESLRKSQSTIDLDNSLTHSTKPKPDLREEKRRVREELERLKWMWIWSMVMEEEELGKRIFNAILWKTMEERFLEEKKGGASAIPQGIYLGKKFLWPAGAC